MRKRVFKIGAFLLAAAMLLSTGAFAAEESDGAEPPQSNFSDVKVELVELPDYAEKASSYIGCTSLAVCSNGGGSLDIFFSITGTRTLDKLGVLWIDLYRGSNPGSGTLVASWAYYDPGCSFMQQTNDFYHQGQVTYTGATIGSCYYAVAMFATEYNGYTDHYRHTSTVSQA